jgi:hypothetical protein
MQYSSCHIIATMRGKDVWNVEPDENGKVKPRKVAQGGDQRSGFEYEFMLTFMIDQESHIATPSKDNTGLFGGRFEVLTEDHGKRLREWATSGKSQDVLLRELTDAAADYAAELKQIYDAHKEGFTEKQCAYIERFINAGAPTDVHAAREFRAQIENAYNAITASLAQREAAVAQG